jgi:hypothetical protein
MDTPRLDTERATADLRFSHEQFESIRSDVRDLASGLTSEQMHWQPSASTWSVAQCLEHLSLFIEHDLERVTALIALARASTRASRGPVPPAADAPMITLHEMPRQSAAAAAATTGGPPTLDPAVDTAARFLTLITRLLGVIARAETIAPTVTTRRSGMILIDMIGHTLQLTALHHWRLVLQARRIKERPGFPRRA